LGGESSRERGSSTYQDEVKKMGPPGIDESGILIKIERMFCLYGRAQPLTLGTPIGGDHG